MVQCVLYQEDGGGLIRKLGHKGMSGMIDCQTKQGNDPRADVINRETVGTEDNTRAGD